MEISDEAKRIVKDITEIFDIFEIPVDERPIYVHTTTMAYFKALEKEDNHHIREEVYYGLEIMRVKEKYKIETCATEK